MFLNGYPYTDFHELNLDFLLRSMEELKKAFASFTASNSLIFAEPLLHDLSKSYAKNTIVLDSDGNAYISLQAVPVGVQLSDSSYWLMVFNFEEYTEKANKNFTVNYLRDTTRAPQAYAVGDWIVLDDVLYTVTQAIAADELFEVGVNIEHFTVEQFLKDFSTSIVQTVNQYKNDIDASELLYRQQLAGDIANTTASLQAQLEQAIAGVTVDSEVIDARVGWDGEAYSTLGNGNRYQFGVLFDNMYKTKVTSVSSGGFIPFSVKAGETVNVKKADGTAFTTATIYFFNANRVEIDHFALTSGIGYERNITPSAAYDSYSIRIIHNDATPADYVLTNTSSPYYTDSAVAASKILNLEGNHVSTMNCDTDFTPGTFRINTISGTLPSGFSTSNAILTNNVYDGWIIQQLKSLQRPDDIYTRYIQLANPQYVWHKLTDQNYAKSGVDVDTITQSGHYTVSSPTGTLPTGYDSGTPAIIDVIGYGENSYADNTPRFIVQKLSAYNNPSLSWVRMIDVVTSTVGNWNTSAQHAGNPLNGKNIVFFGDSLTGNFQPPNDFPSMIAAATGANVYNLGVGGTGATYVSSDPRKDFSLVALADSIASGDYTAQINSGLSITYAADGPSGFIDTGIDYIPTRITTLQSIDWSSIDMAVIAVGTNDWAQGRHVKNNSDSLDVTTFYGALNYAIDTLLTAYPQIRILLVTPSWRWDTGSPYKDSDTWQLYGNYLSEFCDAEKEVAELYHLNVYDQYSIGGFNKPNRLNYFYSNDGTHPKLKGRQLMGSKIGNQLLNI